MLLDRPFPGLCKDVRVGRDEERGWFIQAVRDLPCGEIICVERGVVVSLPDSNVCDFCLTKSYTPYCTDCFVEFSIIRRFEEPFEDQLQQLGIARLAYRVVLSHTPEEMQNIVEESSDPDSVDGFYAVFMLSAMDIGRTDAVEEFCSQAQKFLYKHHPLWSKIKDVGLFRKVFSVVVSRLPRNAHTISHEKFVQGGDPIGTGLFPLCSLFNHSCRANVFSFFKEDVFYFVSKGIKAGEECLDDYGLQAYDACYDVRQRFFQTTLNFTCMCSVCTSHIGRVADDLLFHKDTTCLKVDPFSNMKEFIESSKLPYGHVYKEHAIQRLLATKYPLSWPEKKKFVFDIIHYQAIRGAFLRPEQVPYFMELMIDCPKESTTVAEFECWISAIQARLVYFVLKCHPMQDSLEAIYQIVKSLRNDKLICKCLKMDSPLLSEAASHLERLKDYMKIRSDFHRSRVCV